MITVAMSAVIGAKRERVWRALTVPEELVGWDERVLGLVDRAPGYPTVGQKIRWRYRLGPVTVVMRDAPLEVLAPERLRASLSLGPIRLEETFLLAKEQADPQRTRVSLRVVAANSAAVVGGWVDRFTVRRTATDFVDTRLRSLRTWCEREP